MYWQTSTKKGTHRAVPKHKYPLPFCPGPVTVQGPAQTHKMKTIHFRRHAKIIQINCLQAAQNEKWASLINDFQLRWWKTATEFA